MTLKNETLEYRIYGNTETKFKSKGEQRIGLFLKDNSIDYQYEPAVLVNAGRQKQRIWYPDFYLPEFKNYIEYFGMVGNRNYDQGIKTKQAVYAKARMDVVSIYPWMFKENWRGYIMQGLEKNTLRRYRNLMTKPYWSKNRPLPNNYRTRGGYHRQNMKCY